MKPTLKTPDCQKMKDTSTVVQPPVKKTSRRKRGFVLGTVCVFFFIFAAATFAGVYFGMITHKNMKTYWATYHVNGKITIDEKIEITDSEERLSVRDAIVVFDFENELFVLKTSEADPCYVSKFNTSALMKPTQAKEAIHEEHIEKTVFCNTTQVKLRLTTMMADRNILSPLASHICRHVHVYWMAVIGEESHSAGDGGKDNRLRRHAVLSDHCDFWFFLFAKSGPETMCLETTR